MIKKFTDSLADLKIVLEEIEKITGKEARKGLETKKNKGIWRVERKNKIWNKKRDFGEHKQEIKFRKIKKAR